VVATGTGGLERELERLLAVATHPPIAPPAIVGS
jgi:hypothetical protein